MEHGVLRDAPHQPGIQSPRPAATPFPFYLDMKACRLASSASRPSLHELPSVQLPSAHRRSSLDVRRPHVTKLTSATFRREMRRVVGGLF